MGEESDGLRDGKWMEIEICGPSRGRDWKNTHLLRIPAMPSELPGSAQALSVPLAGPAEQSISTAVATGRLHASRAGVDKDRMKQQSSHWAKSLAARLLYSPRLVVRIKQLNLSQPAFI